jgi:GH18 family chitinase
MVSMDCTYPEAVGYNIATNGRFNSSDIDWEYPAAGEQAAAFVSLLAETRAALDAHAESKGDKIPYELSVSFLSCMRLLYAYYQMICAGCCACWLLELPESVG